MRSAAFWRQAGLALVLTAGAGSAAGGAAPPPATEGLAFRGRPVLHQHYDGVTNDLASAGLGSAGLQSANPPPIADPLDPTAEELRRLAIYNNYRALIDTAPGGGYGAFFGPGVPLEPGGAAPPELIAGDEFLVLGGRGRTGVTMMVQVPQSFDPAAACIVTGPSSGSRGVYGAIGTSGEWGLKRGCAVAYTDKGTGTGAHDLEEDSVNLIRGERADAGAAGQDSNFTARISPARQAAFNAETPDRFAFKHAHSEDNPEAAWGRHVLESIQFAFFVLNNAIRPEDDPRLTPANTIVIASSVSNGGGASIRAAERDGGDLIDGVAVSEPNVSPTFDDSFVIRQGDHDPVAEHSRSLYDYTTLLHIFQGCANRAPDNVAAPLNLTSAALGEAGCASLAEKGLLTADGLDAQAIEAQQIINGYGILPEQNVVQPSHWFLNVPQAVAVTYANAYARASVVDNLCGYSFGATDTAGAPVPLPATAETIIFATSNGIPPTGGVNLINNQAPAGPTENRLSISPSTGQQDENLDGALCLRSLQLGQDAASGAPLTGQARAQHRRILQSIDRLRADGDLDGIPTLIATGRADAILPPNHHSRAYFGLNQVVEGDDSNLRYYEILHAQHLDVLNGLPGFNSRFIPLHHYFIQVLNILYDHLTSGAPLPPSQVVRTEPRGTTAGGAVSALDEENIPPIQESPDEADLITFDGAEVFIPE